MPVSQIRIVLVNFRLFSTVDYYARVVAVLVPHINMSFFFEHPIYFCLKFIVLLKPGGPESYIQMALIR